MAKASKAAPAKKMAFRAGQKEATKQPANKPGRSGGGHRNKASPLARKKK